MGCNGQLYVLAINDQTLLSEGRVIAQIALWAMAILILTGWQMGQAAFLTG
jgi:hypothetical protein